MKTLMYWRFTQSDFLLFLIRGLFSTETEVSSNLVKIFSFFFSLFYHFINPFLTLSSGSVCSFIFLHIRYLYSSKNSGTFPYVHLYSRDASIQGSQKLVPEKLPHNLCVCYLYWSVTSVQLGKGTGFLGPETRVWPLLRGHLNRGLISIFKYTC